MRVEQDVPLAPLTTLRLGGPARRLVHAGTEAELVEALRDADAAGEPVLVLAGGSNVVLPDEGWDGTVVRIETRGIERRADGDRVLLTVAAGEPWEPVVAEAVAEGLAGVECLSGIPGSTGATPIQNVGAYGQEVSQTIAAVRVWDRDAGWERTLGPADCGFAYRTSALKGQDRLIVLSVTFALPRAAAGPPVAYAELARALGVEVGRRAPAGAVREAVLELRRGKGMVVDPDDPDSVSAGSFFTNPILCGREWDAFERRVAERLGDGARAPRFAAGDGCAKTSAAWLIERAGFRRGYARGRVALSGKHTLALTNRGGATTAELLDLAREVRDGVRDAFGVTLEPEPRLVGVSL